MKTLSRIFTAAFILFAAVACHTNEIDNPDNPNPKGKSKVTITASIIQTRVSYDCSDPGEVKQHWEENDILFGFWGGSPSESNQIVFMVNGVDPDTGVATLEAVSGAEWIETATEGGTAVDLVYTGDVNNLPFSDSGISVNLSGQTLDRVPGCMHAHATLQIDGDGKKSLEFNFQNDCALIEIDGLTGIAESGLFGEDVSSLALSSVHITHLLLGGSYSFSNGELVFDSDEDSLEDDYAIELEPGWAVGNDGAISGPDRKKILVAVAPNPEEKQITVSSKVSTGEGTLSPSFDYGKRSLAGGLCYVISAQPVVARTSDGKCFKSVSAAFDHAAVLSGQGYTTAEDNVVTLIKKEIGGFGDVSEIEIDYPVTLDLNGCTLSLSGVEYFRVINDYFAPLSGALTITDSTGPDSGGVYDGTINSTSGNSIIFNLGTVNIYGGTLNSVNCDTITNSGTATISGGTITSTNDYAVYNDGELTVSGDDTKITSTKGKAISNDGKVIINGGTITSVEDSAIGNSGSLTVNAGTVSSAQSSAIYSDGYEIIIGQTGSPIISSPNNYSYAGFTYSNGEDQYCAAIFIEYSGDDDIATFTMYGGTVTGDNHAIAMNGSVEAEIKGGILDSDYRTLLVADGASCTISGGQIYCSNNTQPTITCFCTDSDIEGTSLTIECGDDTKKEPLIYSVANITQNGSGGTRYDVPISAICDWAYSVDDYDRHYDNYATVEISGGYLYSATEYYFAQSDEVFSSENVDVSFYSNVNKMSQWNGNISEYSGSGITTTALTGKDIVNIYSTYLKKQLSFGYHMTN